LLPYNRLLRKKGNLRGYACEQTATGNRCFTQREIKRERERERERQREKERKEDLDKGKESIKTRQYITKTGQL